MAEQCDEKQSRPKVRDAMSISTDPMRKLRRLLEYTPHADVSQMIRERDHVLRRYAGTFSVEGIEKLSAEEFAGFLRFENNRHWWGLHRDEARMTARMDLLRWALGVLVDDSAPVDQRIDEIDPVRGAPVVPGLDRAVYTPILLVSEPDSYGVWNSISEAAMTRLGLWPDLTGSSSNGARYAEVNEMILAIASELETDPWTLDALWWAVEKEHDPGSHFVTRGAGPARPRTAAKPRTSKPITRKPARPQAATFLCTNCFQQKTLNLMSDDPNRCIDCA